MTKFLDLFEPIQKGNFGLTDEAIYKSIQRGGVFIPIWGGNQEHITIDRLISTNGRTKSNEPITIFEGEGIIISLDGSAGNMTYKTGERFVLNHHAGFCKVKEDGKDKIIPEFFALFYQKQLEEASISEGSRTLTIEKLHSLDFDIPPYDVQEKIMKIARPLLARREKIVRLLRKLTALENKTSYNYRSYQANDIPIETILEYTSGNSGLTEEEIYQKIGVNGERYAILSSATNEENLLGEIPLGIIRGKPLKTFEDKEGILVTRNGVYAGTTFFLEKGKYTLTDHAYVLSLKEGCPYQISLKWLMYQLKHVFFEYCFSSDNRTWNMTGFFKNVRIDIPAFNEQTEIVAKYDKLEILEQRLNAINTKIDEIFAKQIVTMEATS